MNSYNYLNNNDILSVSAKLRNIICSPLLFFSIAALTLLAACHSQRKVAKAPIKEYGAEFLFEKMEASRFHFETLSMKASITAASNNSKGGSTNLTGNIRMIRDSVIWASVSLGLGIEVARLYVTQDSVFFLNRINNEYAASSFVFFNTFYQVDLDFNILQSLLTGNDFDYYESTKFKVSYDGGRYKLTAQERHKQKKYIRSNNDARRVLIQDTWLNSENFKIEAMNIKALENQQRKLQVDYSHFGNVDGELFPQRLVFEIFMQESGKNMKSSVNVSFSKIERNKEVSVPFSIPDKYKKMEL